MADFRTIWFKGEDGEWSPKKLHAIDASHALEVDPEHWSAEKPADPVIPADEPDVEDGDQ